MGISPVSGAGFTSAATQTAPGGNASLNMSDFFTLMAAELQNQTMYDTVDNAEYMGQLAQFSMLSQLQELSKKCDSAYAVSFLGKDVTVTVVDDNGLTQEISGAVEQVSFSGGKAYVTVGGKGYDASDVVSVRG